MSPDAPPEPLVAAAFATQMLEALDVSYLIGGSFASSLHGEPRSTNDVDIVADLLPAHVDSLVARARPECYVSEDAVRQAVATGGSCNLVHWATSVKIDLFVCGADLFERVRLRQRQKAELPLAGGRVLKVFVDTPENTILRKLEWFRRGGESSERQWLDVLAVLRANSGLDELHLEEWAQNLRVSDLLKEAKRQASSGHEAK